MTTAVVWTRVAWPATLAVAVSVAAVLAGGCDVLDVRPEADAAVADWAAATGETDACRLDAMQHCVGAALAARRFGPGAAVLLGMLNELDQADFDPMDLHNNQAGVGCAGESAEMAGAAGSTTCCAELLNADPPSLRTDGRCE